MNIKIKKLFSNIFIPLIVAFFNIILIFYPREIVGASRDGIDLWFNNVFPSLLPFLIGINILQGLGVVNFIGTIFEPFMLFLFKTPGASAFPIISGAASGYPMGAKVTSELREKNLISRKEGNILLCFTNNSGPLFIIGTIGITLFKNPSIGYFLLVVHYLSSIVLGMLLKFFNKDVPVPYKKDRRILMTAYRKMMKERKGRNMRLPLILSTSIKNSMETILLIGGYIILFNVIIEIIDILNILLYIDSFFNSLGFFQENSQILHGVVYGFFEVTSGVRHIASLDQTMHTVLSAAFILSFGGLCIHFQSFSFISKTDLNFFIYLLGKLFHGVISVAVGLVIYPFFNFSNGAAAVFYSYESSFFRKLVFSSWSFVFSIFILIIVIAVLKLLEKILGSRRFR